MQAVEDFVGEIIDSQETGQRDVLKGTIGGETQGAELGAGG